jgi:hypothetical protein
VTSTVPQPEQDPDKAEILDLLGTLVDMSERAQLERETDR